MSRLVIVDPGEELNKGYILKRIQALGHKMVILRSSSTWADKYAESAIEVNFENPDQVVAYLSAYQKKYPVDGIITFIDRRVRLCAELNAHFGFFGIGPDVANICRNKGLFRKYCLEHGINMPQTWVIENRNDWKSLRINPDESLVLKPAESAGSLYVFCVDSIDAAKTVWEKYPHKKFLVEKFIRGVEVDIDLLVQNGVCIYHNISENTCVERPYRMQASGNWPASLAHKQAEACFCLVQKLVRLLRIQNACLHIEAIVDKDTVYPLEINARMGGAETHFFNERARGVDLIAGAISVATNQKFAVNSYLSSETFYAHGIFANQLGCLKDIVTSQSIDLDPDVSFFNYTKVGTELALPPESFNLLGTVVASASDLPSAREKAERMAKNINYKVIT